MATFDRIRLMKSILKPFSLNQFRFCGIRFNIRSACSRGICSLLFILFFSGEVIAQKFVEKLDLAIEIPSVIALKATPLHLYTLSETEGLVVFRQSSDSLQWLYSSSGMQRRGSELDADARFAYIYGNGRRLGVIEPTSVLGVYSSTTLPTIPKSVARTGVRLWIALGEAGLGSLSLSTPEAVDQGVVFPFQQELQNHSVIQTLSEPSSTLFVLTQQGGEFPNSGANNDDAMRWLHRFSVVSADSIQFDLSWSLKTPEGSPHPSNLHLMDGILYVSNPIGEFFKVLLSEDEQQLSLEYWTSFGHEIDEVGSFGDEFFIRTRNGKLWVGNRDEGFTLSRQDAEAGNLAVSHHGVYLSQFDRVSPLQLLSNYEQNSTQIGPSVNTTSASSTIDQNLSFIPSLVSIPDQVFPLGATIILPVEQENPIPADRINFSLLNPVSGASIRGQSMIWTPTSSQVGRNSFTLLATSTTGATDTTTFAIEVRPFNAPPLFAPSRPLSIPAGDAFETQFRATDPDGEPASLIRYLGVDLPSGASLDEQSGQFRWNPELRQVGTHRFRIVATDQYGAAANLQVEIQVIDL